MSERMDTINRIEKALLFPASRMKSAFVVLGNILVVSLALVFVGACSDDDDTNSCLIDGPLVEILENHQTSGGDHQLAISADDVVEGTEKVYDIQGDNVGHTHSLTVDADSFGLLQEATTVTITSSDTGAAGQDHTHDVRLSCP